MLRSALKILGVIAAVVILGVVGLYALLVFGQRRAVHYHYG